MVNHYVFHVIFQDNEHQLIYFFMKSSLNLEESLSTQNYILEAFATLPNHINYLHPNIEYITIHYFYHDLLSICYQLLHTEKYSDIFLF